MDANGEAKQEEVVQVEVESTEAGEAVQEVAEHVEGGETSHSNESSAENIAQLLRLLDPETLKLTYKHNPKVLLLHKKLERAQRFGTLLLDESERKIIRAIRFGTPLADESQKLARIERFKDVLKGPTTSPSSSSSAASLRDDEKLAERAKRFGLPIATSPKGTGRTLGVEKTAIKKHRGKGKRQRKGRKSV
eukprot:TRINITY_DN2356_c0_g1_i1.p1 TRINITY_DN2356_c0_g1~~TRINITY_DN2356_c0_g1_i1.p1  ORF type:complete len:199 (-),score=79.45 TRINITY_DN2356_c0_g1_i1:120-695(-)